LTKIFLKKFFFIIFFDIIYIIMSIKSSLSLVQEALKIVKTISATEALQLFKEKECNLIDIRDTVELEMNGRIENASHISRGLLEFSIHPDSPYFKKEKLDIKKPIILFCAAGGRSALAAKTLNEMGFENVSHVEGGFSLMKNKGFKII